MMTRVGTIRRSELVRAARLTIADVRADGITVPRALARQVMNVARTAERITASWRSADDSCGCLIGTLHPDRSFVGVFDTSGLSDAEHEIGHAFPWRLGNCDGIDPTAPIYEVVDE